MMRTLMMVGLVVSTIPMDASAQTYFIRQSMKNPGRAPAAKPRTLTCGAVTVGIEPSPSQGNSQPLTITYSMQDAQTACNTVGAQYGEMFKDFNYCMVYDTGGGAWYTYFYKATGTAPSPYSNRATASCTYNP
jgi:hypothetical protein